MKLLLPLVATALAACAAHPETGTSRDQDALARELAGMRAGEARRCIPAQEREGLTIVDQRTLTLRSGRTLWVNRLDAPCPGLRPLDTLIVELHGSQYCRNDRIRGLDPGSSIPGQICLLGDWRLYREARAG